MFYITRLTISLMIFVNLLHANETFNVKFADDLEIEVTKFKSKGDNLMIIFPSEHGITQGVKQLSKDLQNKHVETWLVDPYTSLFLSPSVSSLKKIPIDAYTNIIEEGFKSKKNVYVFSNDKASMVLLNTVHAWQEKSKEILSGVILLSPNIYKKTPQAGDDGKFHKIASSTNNSLSLLIPKKSTLTLRINDIVKELKISKSDISLKILPKVRDRFFFRNDASTFEKKYSLQLADIIIGEMKNIKKYSKKRKVPKLQKASNNEDSNKRSLKKYTGKLKSKNFTLQDLEDNIHELSKYKNKVILVNFWASWCPPCVHEMPSMSRLKNSFKDKDFEILAINLGEDKSDIIAFAKKYKINFPILLDASQKQASAWKVFAFPTSYILDKNSKIRYSIAGGFDWDTIEVKNTIDKLIEE